ncbi:hypothetical protein [Luteipulveratus halotolerans]|uniref:Uncharacterized protein n=1 Tax=Luteipulveratus halotolerans TaxID=1631356 RepID=A0A0L6CLQ3_9MICO|nr:hypothetical protein [Luteipulveratus halotolerans]KNX38438.1 hypothetical protein VV01_16865 [Luteipulveratus halotolerans]
MSDSGDISAGFATAPDSGADAHHDVDHSHVAPAYVTDRVDPVGAAIDTYAHRNGAAPPRAQETSQDG